MDMTSIAIGGISVIVIVVGLVQVSKRLGVSGKGALVLALVLGVILCLAIQATTVWPWLSPWLVAVVQGVVVGLTASGLYDVGKAWQSK